MKVASCVSVLAGVLFASSSLFAKEYACYSFHGSKGVGGVLGDVQNQEVGKFTADDANAAFELCKPKAPPTNLYCLRIFDNNSAATDTHLFKADKTELPSKDPSCAPICSPVKKSTNCATFRS